MYLTGIVWLPLVTVPKKICVKTIEHLQHLVLQKKHPIILRCAMAANIYNTDGCIIDRVLSKSNLHEGDGGCALRHSYVPIGMNIPPLAPPPDIRVS